MNILVLCHGNKYRSPACAAFLQGAAGINIDSSGFSEPGKPAAKRMRDMMATYGFDLTKHRSKTIDADQVNWAQLILYMDGGNRKRLEAAFPQAMRKARCLAEFIGEQRIPDPAFINPKGPTFEEIVDKIRRASAAVIKQYGGK